MKHHTLGYFSSYDRGLEHLLKLWPEITTKYPDVKLHIAYGWDLFDRAYQNNPERMNWKDRINNLMNQKGITHHGRVGKKQLSEIRKQCGIWAYPTHFTEINCITALECQSDGLVPVVIDLAALKETVGSGIKVSGDIYDPEIKEKYLSELLGLMGNKEEWELYSESAKEFAKDYSWKTIANKWVKEFK